MNPNYQTHPIPVEARQLSAKNREELKEWADGWYYDSNGESELYFNAEKGGQCAGETDWIVKYDQHTFRVVKDSDFQKLYAKIPSQH